MARSLGEDSSADRICRFRWVACQIEVLSKSKTLKQLENALRTPPKDLIDTYRRALEGLDPESYEIVCKVLRLLTVSPRPVSTKLESQ